MKSVKESCQYTEVYANGEVTENNIIDGPAQLSWRNVMRQVLVCTTMWTLYFIHGLHIGTPTVLISQQRRERNSTTPIDDELASWITSMIAFGAWPWTFIVPILGHKIGRKKIFIIICISGFIGSIVTYVSTSITQILVGEFIEGIIYGGISTIFPLIITEYSSPKYRGLFLTIKSASIFWGIWVANIIGTFWHWKNIYLIAIICHIYTLIAFAWPESPYWLAKEKRFVDCVKINRKLKGNSLKAEQDLKYLINQYKENINEVALTDTALNDRKVKSKSIRNWFIASFNFFPCKAFYKPMILAGLLGIQYHLMGKFICTMYALQILKKITGNEGAAYKGMLILDGVTVLSTYCGCAISRLFKRRTMLFISSALSITVLYILALYLFLCHTNIISENNFVSISLLTLFSVSVCGPMILVSSIYAELISIKYQRPSAMIFGTLVTTIFMVSLKISLFLFKTLTLPGAFLFFALSSSIATIILYLYLPETKDKTVQEIEMYFKTSKSISSSDKTNLQPLA